MNLRSKTAALPWISAAVGAVGTICPFLLPTPISWSITDAWLTYLFILAIVAMLSVIAYLDWRQRRDSQLPSSQQCALILHLAKHGFSGAPSEFNKDAEAILYGKDFSVHLPGSTDYYSQMMSDGLIEVSSITDNGNKPDGTPDTAVNVRISAKGVNILRILSETQHSI